MDVNSEKLADVSRYIVEVAHPDKVILFGSAARGDISPNSDLDILVYTQEEWQSHARENGLFYRTALHEAKRIFSLSGS
jgi:predicted nucleotidyltransferase